MNSRGRRFCLAELFQLGCWPAVMGPVSYPHRSCHSLAISDLIGVTGESRRGFKSFGRFRLARDLHALARIVD